MHCFLAGCARAAASTILVVAKLQKGAEASRPGPADCSVELFNRVTPYWVRSPTGSGRIFHLAIQPGRKMMTRFPVEYNCNLFNREITYLKISPCTRPSLTAFRRMVRSNISYRYSKKLKCRMQCTQNKIIRFMLNAPWRFHVGANEFKHVGLLPIEYRVELSKNHINSNLL